MDVEFDVPPDAEIPFGYKLASAMGDEFYSSKDLCSVLRISPSVMGKIVGAIKLDNRMDIGLNLKRNGSYQLAGYTRRVDYNRPHASSDRRKAWVDGDTIQIIGSSTVDTPDAVAEAENCGWEYTPAAASLISAFKAKFPDLFTRLDEIPHQGVYSCDQLFGSNGKAVAEDVMDWMKAQPFFSLPRTPFSTHSLSK